MIQDSTSGSLFLEDIDYKDIGRQVRCSRLYAGLTQEELADLIDCEVSYISRIENGSGVGIETLLRIARLLRMDLDILFRFGRYAENEFVELVSLLTAYPPHKQFTARAFLRWLAEASLE